MYESPYIQGCMYVIIICWILGNMYGGITLDIGAYLSYITFLYKCVCVYSYFLHSAIKKLARRVTERHFNSGDTHFIWSRWRELVVSTRHVVNLWTYRTER